mgnify:CR=1 FL=1
MGMRLGVAGVLLVLSVLFCFRDEIPLLFHSEQPDIVVIGAALIDFLAEPHAEELLLKTSNPGVIHRSWGGVSRNIAHSVSISLPELHSTATTRSIFFISVVGDDLFGKSFYEEHRRFDTSGVQQLPGHTGLYLAVSEGTKWNNDMHTAISEVDILSKLSPSYISQYEQVISHSKLIAIDANLSIEAMKYLSSLCKGKVEIWFEPTSVPKSVRIFEAGIDLSTITYISPNVVELKAMAEFSKRQQAEIPALDIDSSDDLFYEKQNVWILLNSGIKYVITTLGPKGTLLGYLEEENELQSVTMEHFPAPPADVIQVNGAGDAMAGCCISSLITGRSVHESIEIGHLCAKLQLEGKPLSELQQLLTTQ